MTTTDDLIARAQAVLDAAEKMTPGPWKSRGVMIDPAIACIPHRPSMYTLGRTDESTPADDARADADATGIATLRNDAPAVIRDLIARLADQAPGLTVGAMPVGDALRSLAVLEWADDVDWHQYDPVERAYRFRHRRARSWSSWQKSAPPKNVTVRLVPLADADRDPAERGPL